MILCGFLKKIAFMWSKLMMLKCGEMSFSFSDSLIFTDTAWHWFSYSFSATSLQKKITSESYLHSCHLLKQNQTQTLPPTVFLKHNNLSAECTCMLTSIKSFFLLHTYSYMYMHMAYLCVCECVFSVLTNTCSLLVFLKTQKAHTHTHTGRVEWGSLISQRDHQGKLN